MQNIIKATLTGLAVLALSLGSADAKSDKPKKKFKNKGYSVSAKCPPGLAKKRPACVPPGKAKAKKKPAKYARGDRFRGSDPVYLDYRRYGLPRLAPGKSYYRVGDNILAVDDDTRQVLGVISILARVSN